MKEFTEKLIGRLEEEKQRLRNLKNDCVALSDHEVIAIEEGAYNFCKNIVNELAEEYKSRIMIDNEYCWQKCGATEHCKECSRLGNGTTDFYENYDSLAEEYNNGWIPCSERLPEKYGEYLCCDRYGEYIIGYPTARVSSDNYYVETEYEIMNDCIAWQPLPQPFKEEGASNE